LTQDDPLSVRVEPILGWIDDEDAREAADRDHQLAVAALESALDRNTPRLKLERLANDVLRFQQGMPETLGHRYRQRLAEIDLAETRTRRLYIGSALVVLLLLAGFVGLMVHRQTRANEVARLAV